MSRRPVVALAPTNQKSDPGSWQGTLAMPRLTPSVETVVLVPTVPAASGPMPRTDSGTGLVVFPAEAIWPRTRTEPIGSEVAGSGPIDSGVAAPGATGVPSGNS